MYPVQKYYWEYKTVTNQSNYRLFFTGTTWIRFCKNKLNNVVYQQSVYLKNFQLQAAVNGRSWKIEQFSLWAKCVSCTITMISYRTLRVLQKLIRSKNLRVIITYLIIYLLLNEKVEWQRITGLFHTCIKILRMWSLLVLSDTKYENLTQIYQFILLYTKSWRHKQQC